MACLDCSQCESLGQIDICCESVTFGTIAGTGDRALKITDITTGAIFIRTITVEEGGEITLLLAGLYAKFTTGRTYEVRVFELLCDFSEPAEITNGETIATCFGFEFFRSTDLTPAE